MSDIVIVFSLENVLISWLKEMDLDAVWLKSFAEKGRLLDSEAFGKCIIHPGTLELIKLLDTMPNITLAFFDDAISEKNAFVVEKLLLLALGEERYHAIKDKVKIFSENDLVMADKKFYHQQAYFFNISPGKRKKNLRLVNDDLSSVVLIDCDITYTHHNQEKNTLKVESASSNAFGCLYYEVQDNRAMSNDHVCNHVFYVAGLLFSAMVKANKEKSLIDILFDLQYETKSHDNEIAYKFNSKIREKNDLYDFGLQTLKAVDSSLTFFRFQPEPGASPEMQGESMHLRG